MPSMVKEMFAGIHRKRWFWTIAIGTLYVMFSDYLIHGVMLKDRYMQTSNLWRTDADMKRYMLFMLLGQFIAGTMFATLFARGYQGKGLREGLRFGILIGLFSTAPSFINYAVMPLPQDLFWSWVAFGFIQCVIGGLVVAKVYGKK